MTREEASNLFNQIKDGKQKFNEVCGEKDYIDFRVGNNFFEALDMAIKALKQEPCEDCISRQAAIEAFEKFIHELGIEDEPYNYGEMALSVKNVPSVTPKPKTDVLDKIRAEIELNRNEWIKGKDAEWHTYDRCLLIIDKYKAESEEKE